MASYRIFGSISQIASEQFEVLVRVGCHRGSGAQSLLLTASAIRGAHFRREQVAKRRELHGCQDETREGESNA